MMTCDLDPCNFECPDQFCIIAHWPEHMKESVRIRRTRATVPHGLMLSVPLEPGFYVYLHKAANGRVLYVGKTTNPATRVANHIMSRKRSPWFGQVANIEWHRYEQTEVMDDVERELIATHRPTWNRQHKPMTVAA